MELLDAQTINLLAASLAAELGDPPVVGKSNTALDKDRPRGMKDRQPAAPKAKPTTATLPPHMDPAIEGHQTPMPAPARPEVVGPMAAETAQGRPPSTQPTAAKPVPTTKPAAQPAAPKPAEAPWYTGLDEAAMLFAKLIGDDGGKNYIPSNFPQPAGGQRGELVNFYQGSQLPNIGMMLAQMRR